MAVPLEPARAAADQQDRQVVVRVLVPVAHAAAVEERRVIQEVAVAVGRRPEPLEEAGEELQMVRVDLGFLGDLFRNAVVVRDRVVSIGHANLRIAQRAELARQHERRHPRGVALIRQRHQLEHQLGVLFP